MSNIETSIPIPIPKPMIAFRETRINCRPVDDGRIYMRYISYVTSEQTAMSWAEPAAVTAINSMANNSMAPVSPNTVEAAVGATRSLLISLEVSDTPNAMADRPNVVAMVKGIAN